MTRPLPPVAWQLRPLLDSIVTYCMALFTGHGECGARAYNGGLWRNPQRGSLKRFVFCVSKQSHNFAPSLIFVKFIKSHMQRHVQ